MQGAKIMTIDQVEGNEPIHENFGTQLGNEIDEVRLLDVVRVNCVACVYFGDMLRAVHQ
jgi:hypothetical protein